MPQISIKGISRLQRNQGSCIPKPMHSSRPATRERRPPKDSTGHSNLGFALECV